MEIKHSMLPSVQPKHILMMVVFSFFQNTTNLNFSKGITDRFNFAIGAEGRFERYKIYAGEEASYTNYDPSGNKATGAQGFPGYQPNDVVSAKRSVVGLYAGCRI